VVWPWLLGGVAVLVMVVGVVALTSSGDDDGDVSSSTTTEATEPTTETTRPATTTTSEPDSVVFVDDLRVGQCFDDPLIVGDFESVSEITLVGCESPHDGEVFAVSALADAPGAPWQGEDDTTTRSDGLCAAQYQSYVGVDPSRSRWTYGLYSPTEESWQNDDRLVVCLLQDPDDNQLQGSKRDTRE
jgi:hypothetical protein